MEFNSENHYQKRRRVVNETALSAAGVSVSFGGVEALSGVSIEVPAGARVAVLGPNGAGKTTLFELAAGTLDPDSGSIELASQRVAFVPQSLDVEPAFPVTVTDVVRMGRYRDLGMLGRFGDRDRTLVAGAIAALGIEDLADRRFSRLSGGERQRALLAQAAAEDADIILLDEPFTGVDAPTRGSVRSLLDSWRDQGRTVLVATHDLERAARDFDLVLCLNHRVVAFGPPQEVCTEAILGETFAGGVVRVGEMFIDITHHHHGAG